MTDSSIEARVTVCSPFCFHITEPPSNGHVVQAGDSSHSGSAQGSWGEGGISDAPTAPVMDSDQDVTTPAVSREE